jgi:uncharacterized protein (TIGR00369 family)
VDTRTVFKPRFPGFAERVRESFAKQGLMTLFGAEMAALEPGYCEIRVVARPELTQQHGYVHAGVTAAIADSACGYAAFSLMPEDAAVLTVEYKINLLAPAAGKILLARGRVIRDGRTLKVARGEVFCGPTGTETLCAEMLNTIMTLHGRGDLERLEQSR